MSTSSTTTMGKLPVTRMTKVDGRFSPLGNEKENKLLAIGGSPVAVKDKYPLAAVLALDNIGDLRVQVSVQLRLVPAVFLGRTMRDLLWQEDEDEEDDDEEDSEGVDLTDPSTWSLVASKAEDLSDTTVHSMLAKGGDAHDALDAVFKLHVNMPRYQGKPSDGLYDDTSYVASDDLQPYFRVATNTYADFDFISEFHVTEHKYVCTPDSVTHLEALVRREFDLDRFAAAYWFDPHQTLFHTFGSHAVAHGFQLIAPDSVLLEEPSSAWKLSASALAWSKNALLHQVRHAFAQYQAPIHHNH